MRARRETRGRVGDDSRAAGELATRGRRTLRERCSPGYKSPQPRSAGGAGTRREVRRPEAPPRRPPSSATMAGKAGLRGLRDVSIRRETAVGVVIRVRKTGRGAPVIGARATL